MAWIIGFASDQQIKQIRDAGFEVENVVGECEDVLRANYPASEDDSQRLIWIDLDLEVVGILDIADEEELKKRKIPERNK